MPAQRSTRPTTRRVRLRATSAVGRGGARTEPDEPVIGWLWAAVGGGLIAAIAGWILVTGLAVIGWLPGEDGALGEVLLLGTRLWLLAHGAAVTVGAATWTLPPLGVTLLVGFTIVRVAAFASGQALLAASSGPSTPPVGWRDRALMTVRVAATVALVYVGLIATAAVLVPGTEVPRAVIGGLIVAIPTAVAGAVAGSDLDVLGLLPAWARPVPRAVLAAQLVTVAGGSAVVVAALIGQHQRVGELGAALGGGPTGVIAITALQIAYLPTVIVWAASWALGAGFSVGAGTVVSPANTQLGLLPAVPLAGALPAEGPGDPWALAWLGLGVLAGVAAAVLVMRGRPRARFDETGLVGGLSGVLAGLGFLLLAVVASGDLGANRLTGLGPRLTELAVTAPVLMGLAGMATGLVWGLVRRPRGLDEPTIAVGRRGRRAGRSGRS